MAGGWEVGWQGRQGGMEGRLGGVGNESRKRARAVARMLLVCINA